VAIETAAAHDRRRNGLCAGLAALALVTCGAAALAETTPPQTALSPGGGAEANGTVDVPGFRLPPSIYPSDEAKAALPRKPFDQEDLLYQILKTGNAANFLAL
jgi:monoterpene epsilon-lactone hydrolase